MVVDRAISDTFVGIVAVSVEGIEIAEFKPKVGAKLEFADYARKIKKYRANNGGVEKTQALLRETQCDEQVVDQADLVETDAAVSIRMAYVAFIMGCDEDVVWTVGDVKTLPEIGPAPSKLKC